MYVSYSQKHPYLGGPTDRACYRTVSVFFYLVMLNVTSVSNLINVNLLLLLTGN